MAAGAIILILVVLLIVINWFGTSRGLEITASTLGGCLVGITIAAIIVSSVLYCYKRNRDTVIREHAWKIFSLAAENPVNNLQSQVSHTSQQKSTSPINHRETRSRTQVDVGERQHREIRHLCQPVKTQENSTLVAVDVQIHTELTNTQQTEHITVTPHRTTSQLESYC